MPPKLAGGLNRPSYAGAQAAPIGVRQTAGASGGAVFVQDAVAQAERGPRASWHGWERMRDRRRRWLRHIGVRRPAGAGGAAGRDLRERGGQARGGEARGSPYGKRMLHRRRRQRIGGFVRQTPIRPG
jgi:hypothetical protein